MSELRVGAPLVSVDLTIVPVEAVGRDHWLANGRFWASGFKEPRAIVLLTRSTVRAIDVSGIEVDIEKLCTDVPELRDFLNSWSD